jgi:hypothetical protein
VEKVELVNIALLWCVALMGAIQAINAKGYLRAAISWILVTVICVIAFFFSSLKAMDLRNFFSMKSPDTHLEVLPPSPSVQIPAESSDSLSLIYRAHVVRLLRDSKENARLILAFNIANPSSLNAQRQEKEENRARAMRNESANLYQQFRGLKVPDAWNAFHEDLLSSMEYLRLAGYETHALFSAEPGTAPGLLQESHRHAQLAMDAIIKAEQQLSLL